MVGHAMGDSTPKREKRLLQNGEIPGYGECVEDLARTCPRCLIKTCCDEVGGMYSQGRGGFPNCNKIVTY